MPRWCCRRSPDTMVVPETAVEYTLYGDSVYVIHEDGKDADGQTDPARRPNPGQDWNAVGQQRRDTQRVEAGRAGRRRRPSQIAERGASRGHRLAAAAAAGASDAELTLARYPHVVHRHLHPPAGAGAGRQPADPADRAAGDAGTADPAIPQAVEHDDHGHHRLSRRDRRSDAGLHHDAVDAGDRDRRGRRLPDLVLDPGHQHDHRLHPARFRPGQGADRSDGQGPAGQIPDPDRGPGPGHRQGDRPNDGGHVYRVFERRAVERRDLGLSDPGRAAVARHGRRASPLPTSSAARSSPCGCGSIRREWRRAASRPSDVAAAIQANNYQAAPGQAKGHYTVTNVSDKHRADRCRPVPEHGGQGQERRVGADGRHRHRRSRRAELDLERHDERAARRVHRHPGDAGGQSANPGQGRARAVARDPAQPAAIGPYGSRL